MTKRKRRPLLTVGILLGVVALLMGILQIIVNLYVEPMMGERLKTLVQNGSEGLYRIRFTDIDLSLWTGTATIEGVELYTDSTEFNRLKERNALPPVTVKINLGKGRIKGLKMIPLVRSRELTIDRIFSQDADITVYRHFQNNRPKGQPDSTPVWKLIRPDLNSIAVDLVELDHIRVSYFNRDSSTAFRWNFSEFNAKISDIRIDSASAADTRKLLYADDIGFDVHHVSLSTADSLYGLSMGKFSYSFKDSRATVDSFMLKPAVGRAAFYKKTGMEKDIYTVYAPEIRLTDFHPERYLTDNTVTADSLLVSHAKIDIYHDRVPKDDTASKLGHFPHQLLLKTPFGIRIKAAKGDDISIRYTEKHDATLTEGSLYFKNISGLALYISNDPDDIKAHPYCEIKVKGRFMKNTVIEGRFKLDLTKTDGSFSAEARISPTDVRVLNPVTEALGSARFKSLQTGQTYFRIHGNEFGAYGYLKMPYTGLHMELLSIPEAGREARGKKFVTWVVKNFSFNDNPKKGEPLRIAENVYYRRDIHRSFFNLIWKTLFTAAKDVATKESMKKMIKKRQEKTANRKVKVPAADKKKNKAK